MLLEVDPSISVGMVGLQIFKSNLSCLRYRVSSKENDFISGTNRGHQRGRRRGHQVSAWFSPCVSKVDSYASGDQHLSAASPPAQT